MKERLKTLWFGMMGKDPQAVVVSFATGSAERVRPMVEEAVRLMPGRRHFVVGFGPLPEVEGVTPVALRPAGVMGLMVQLRALHQYRVGMAPTLFDGEAAYAPLRCAAFLLAPGKILAYNARLERHHLQLRSWLASWLFWRGVPLDRIFLRPRWLWWTTADHTSTPDDSAVLKGRLPRPGRRRVGVLTPFTPYPLSHGGAVRLYSLIREMAVEYDVYLFAFREREKAEDLEPLLAFCTSLAVVSKPRYREPRWATLSPPEVNEYESAPMRRLLAKVMAEHHVEALQVEYTQLARYRGDILVEHDVTFDLYQQLHQKERTVASWWDWWRWQRFERRAIGRYRRVVTMSEKDSRLLGAPHAHVIANGVDLERFRPTEERTGARVLFIGSFRHFPNVTAFRFFVEEVWPLVRDACPEMTVTVVAGPEPDLYWQAATGETALPIRPRIRLLGFVSDVRPLYEEANIVLAPTLVSAGTNVKVLEAMAMERAIVSTTSGVGGIPVEHGKDVWIADGAEPFARGILTLAADAELRQRLAKAARALVEKQFDWGTLGLMQRDLIREMLPERVTIREGTAGDLPGVREVQAVALPTSRWDPEHYLHHEFFVAFYEGSLAGFIVARKTAPDEREILNIAVTPEFRRLGIGEALLDKLIYSGEAGDVFLEVRESNMNAQRLYERVGFTAVGRRHGYYEDPPETAVIMRIQVAGSHASFQNSSASERRT